MRTDEEIVESRISTKYRKLGIRLKIFELRAIVQHLKPFPQELNKFDIDHVKPIASFDLSDPAQVKELTSPQNHQWLKHSENMTKSYSENFPRLKESSEEQFEKELIRRGLSDATIKEYMFRFRVMPKNVTPTLQTLYDFLDTYSGSVARAFIKIYAEVYGITDFKIPKRTGRKPQRLVSIMTEEEYDKLRNAMYKRNVKWGLMLDLSYWCGLRREEVCNIAISWFVLDEWEEGKSCRLKIIGKGNKERLVIVPAWLMPTLLEFMQHRASHDAISETDRLFGVGVYWWWDVFSSECKKVLGKRYKPHELRHTRTVMWRRQGVPIDQVSKRLGHTSIATTQRYWNLDPEEVAKDWEEEVS